MGNPGVLALVKVQQIPRIAAKSPHGWPAPQRIGPPFLLIKWLPGPRSNVQLLLDDWFSKGSHLGPKEGFWFGLGIFVEHAYISAPCGCHHMNWILLKRKVLPEMLFLITPPSKLKYKSLLLSHMLLLYSYMHPRHQYKSNSRLLSKILSQQA